MRGRKDDIPLWTNIDFYEELKSPEGEQGDYIVGYAAHVLFGKGRGFPPAGDFVEARMAPGAGAVGRQDRGTFERRRPCRC